MGVDKDQASSEREKLEGLQVARAVASVAVLLFHTASKQAEDFGVRLPGLSWFSAFGFAGVDLFFVLSGFVITWASWDDIGRPSRLPAFLMKRLIRILPVFWLVWLLSAVVYFCIFDVRFFTLRSGTIFSQTARAVLLVDPTAHSIIPPAWTLTWELLFYGLFAVVLLFPRVLLPVLLALWASLIGAGLALSWTAMPVSPFCFQFILGSAAAIGARQRPAARPAVWIGLGLTAWLGVIVALVADTLATETPAARAAAFGPASSVLLYGLTSLDLQRRTRYGRGLVRLGEASYVLYLVHVTVLFVLQVYFPRIATTTGHVAWAAAAILLSLAAALAVHLWIERPLLAGFRSLRRPALQAAAVVGVGAAMLGVAAFLHVRYTPPETPLPQGFPTLEAMQFPAEVQGWADVALEGSGDLRVRGWAMDREREELIDLVLVYVDGKVRKAVVPCEEWRGLPKAKARPQQQPGFSLVLPHADIAGASLVRFVAVLPEGRFGRLGVQFEGKADPAVLGIALPRK